MMSIGKWVAEGDIDYSKALLLLPRQSLEMAFAQGQEQLQDRGHKPQFLGELSALSIGASVVAKAHF